MDIFILLGLVFAVYGWVKKPEFFKFNKAAFNTFLNFMLIVTVARLILLAIMGPQPIPEPLLRDGMAFRILTVVWEDAVHTLPMLLSHQWLMKNPTSKIRMAIHGAFLAFVCFQFGLGHEYQGEAAVLITGLSMYFVFYKFAKKHGLLTVMLGHVIYDAMTILTLYASGKWF